MIFKKLLKTDISKAQCQAVDVCDIKLIAEEQRHTEPVTYGSRQHQQQGACEHEDQEAYADNSERVMVMACYLGFYFFFFFFPNDVFPLFCHGGYCIL